MVSLAVLVYAGVSLSFSLPVDAESAQGFASAPGAPAEGQRALVVPLVDGARVPTLADPQDTTTLGHPGALLVVGRPGGIVPAQADDTRVVRALAYVRPDRDLAADLVNLTDVPTLDENGTLVTQNMTLNATELAGSGTGFLVKSDHDANVTFVATESVIGQVVRFEPPGRITLLFAAGAAGFVAPILLLVMTHRGAAAGPGPGARLCRDCRAEIPEGDGFCHRCGAYVQPGDAESHA